MPPIGKRPKNANAAQAENAAKWSGDGTRAAQRAAARAGRICLCGCGRAIIARRSTRRFFSPACKMRFHRASGGKRVKKDGLRPGQVRILKALAKARGPMSRAMISEKAEISQGQLSDYIGQVDPVKRAAREAETGIISLLALEYVREEEPLNLDGKLERTYEITESGKAIAMTSA